MYRIHQSTPYTHTHSNIHLSQYTYCLIPRPTNRKHILCLDCAHTCTHPHTQTHPHTHTHTHTHTLQQCVQGFYFNYILTNTKLIIMRGTIDNKQQIYIVREITRIYGTQVFLRTMLRPEP